MKNRLFKTSLASPSQSRVETAFDFLTFSTQKVESSRVVTTLILVKKKSTFDPLTDFFQVPPLIIIKSRFCEVHNLVFA